jgi:hypothetical protein
MSAATRMSVRQALALGALLLLALPFRAVVAQTRAKVAEWQVMRARNRQSEDAGTDRWYQRLAADVPDRATVGLIVSPSTSAADKNRVMFFIAYSLAPRRIVMTPDAPWVIVAGPIDPGAPPFDPRAFALVRTFPPDLRLFRRIAP